MTEKAEIGSYGERLAKEYLEKKGYEVVKRNWRFRRSEIDIICKQNGLLVFVEVKTRSYTHFGHPEEFVDDRKATKVMAGAEAYVYETDWKGDIRFDIVSVLLQKGKSKILHLEDAFY